MRIPGSIVTSAKLAALLLAVMAAGGGCTHAGGKLPVDAPKMLPYQPPDVDEITGVDSSEESEQPAEAEKSSAQKPH
jgi:hypothetical protein